VIFSQSAISGEYVVQAAAITATFANIYSSFSIATIEFNAAEISSTRSVFSTDYMAQGTPVDFNYPILFQSSGTINLIQVSIESNRYGSFVPTTGCMSVTGELHFQYLSCTVYDEGEVYYTSLIDVYGGKNF